MIWIELKNGIITMTKIAQTYTNSISLLSIAKLSTSSSSSWADVVLFSADLVTHSHPGKTLAELILTQV